MQRLVLSVLAVSMLAATSLQGQAAPLNVPSAPQTNVMQIDWKKPGQRYDNHRYGDRYQPQAFSKHKKVQRHHWKRGERYGDWRRHNAVRDWHRHGLKRPAPGQQWIKVNNDYLLIGMATGVIASLIAAR